MKGRRRVAITGMGMVTPLGNSVEETWKGAVEGKSGAGPISLFDASGFPTRIGAEVKGFSFTPPPPLARLHSLDRKTLFAIASAYEAWKDAELSSSPLNRRKAGVFFGSEGARPSLRDVALAYLSFRREKKEKEEKRKPMDLLSTIPSFPALLIARSFSLSGPVVTVSTACTSSAQAIGEAFDRIRRGELDLAVTGGTDTLVEEFMLMGFGLLGALSTRNDEPEKASRPFDLKRDGFLLGEGAGVLILEEMEHAKKRGAKIRAELLGYGSSSNAFRMTDSPPEGEGAYLAMKNALLDARILPEHVDYINAHGTSTQQNDVSETRGIKRCFGERAYRIPVSSTKAMMGHLVAACGAVELILTVKAMEHGIVPPTINYDFPDPECDLDYVPNVARRANVRVAISNVFGFGGNNATLVLGHG